MGICGRPITETELRGRERRRIETNDRVREEEKSVIFFFNLYIVKLKLLLRF